MSEIAEAVAVSIVGGDYAATDPITGKGTIIGGGVAVVGFDPAQGLTSRFALWMSFWLPTSMCPVEFPVEIALTSEGSLVEMPNPLGGEPQPLRIAQIVQMEAPNMPGLPVASRDHIGSRHQFVLDFGNGLPLAPNGLYEWRVRVDADDSRTWSYPFAVAGPQPGPVIG